MSTTENKIEAVLNAFNKDIEEHAIRAEDAFAKLEKMNIDAEEYKAANWQFALNHYVACYLRKLKEFIAKEPLKMIEKRIRFHAYQQHTKGELSDKQEISVAQAAVTVLLEGYVQKFFED